MGLPSYTIFEQVSIDSIRWQSLFGLSGPMSLILLPLGKLEQAQAASCLGPTELKRFAQFTYPKRKLEWLGGRMAAKFAVSTLAGGRDRVETLLWQKAEVTAEADGRPFLRIADASERKLPDISISHSHGLVAAMAAVEGRCGVDIQIVTDSITKVQKNMFFAYTGWCYLSSRNGYGRKKFYPTKEINTLMNKKRK